MAKSGLLLTPEMTEWREFRQDGRLSDPVQVFQKRACFTELAPSELRNHAAQFGRFAIEYETENLRLLGATPVFYLPTPGSEERALGGVAASLVARMGEIQVVLSRLAELQRLVEVSPEKAETVSFSVDGRQPNVTRCTIGAVEDMLTILSHQTQPMQDLLNSMRFIAGFFYPTETLEYTGELAYYRQREWRILSGMRWRGHEVSRPLTESEVEILLEIDRDWFERRMTFPTGEYRRVEQCQYLTEVQGRPLLAWASRIIVPGENLDSAREILWEAALAIPVVDESSLERGRSSDLDTDVSD